MLQGTRYAFQAQLCHTVGVDDVQVCGAGGDENHAVLVLAAKLKTRVHRNANACIQPHLFPSQQTPPADSPLLAVLGPSVPNLILFFTMPT